MATRADDLDREIQQARERTQLLDQFRSLTQQDLDVLNELTRLVEPPAWVTSTTLSRDAVVIAGEAPLAGRLINSGFVAAVSKLDDPIPGPFAERGGDIYDSHRAEEPAMNQFSRNRRVLLFGTLGVMLAGVIYATPGWPIRTRWWLRTIPSQSPNSGWRFCGGRPPR